MSYILSIDQGTTSSRTLIFDQEGGIVASASKEFTQIYPKPSWVEHDPTEIWATQLHTIHEAMQKAKLSYKQITAIGITNQRETTVIWDKTTGEPIANAIVWQDRRTASLCETLKKLPAFEGYVHQNTGLVVDAYFSATKIKWLLENTPGAKEKAINGELLFGTIDTWLIWKLTGGWLHATDYSNASRTMLYNIKTLDWDDYLLETLDIPRSILPEVRPSAGFYEVADKNLFDGCEIPITGCAGDQQAALFGQACFQTGMAKNTYGTGCFMLKNTGAKLVHSRAGLISTIAWGLEGKPVEYALEGSIFIAGSAVQWLRDGLKMIDTAADSEHFAAQVPDTEGVIVVPAFAGLGAPYWDMYARGAIFGLTSKTDKRHLIRATLEAIAYQTKDVLNAMQLDDGMNLQALRVDGGATTNNLLMQFQADILQAEVQLPDTIESTARGAAFLAGIGAGIWTQDQVAQMWKNSKNFYPTMNSQTANRLYHNWQEAVKRTMGWEKNVS